MTRVTWAQIRSSIYLFIIEKTPSSGPGSDHLEAVKFICKDLWNEMFGKQIDKSRAARVSLSRAFARQYSKALASGAKWRVERWVRTSKEISSGR